MSPNVNGVKITLPGSGQVYHGRGNLSIQVEQERRFLLSGGNTVIGVASGIFDQVGSQGSGVARTPLATGHLGASGGARQLTVAFDQWEGNTDDWGPADPDDPIDEKLAVLETEIARANPSSRNPATFEAGPWSADDDTRYEPIPVVFPSVSPSLDFGESSSVFRSRLTAAETINLGAPIDGEGGAVEPDYRLTPAGESTPRIPIAADTLGPGRRGTGRRQQGRETAESALVDANGNDDASPTTQGTKVRPGQVRLRGAFRGTNAADLATRLKEEFLANGGVEQVALEAVRRPDSDPLVGTYVLGSESAIDPIVPQVDGGLYGYELDLKEA